jgi:hypothetical protein
MAFITAALILLLAMIGSISLTLNHIRILKREDLYLQVSKDISSSLRIINLNKKKDNKTNV